MLKFLPRQRRLALFSFINAAFSLRCGMTIGEMKPFKNEKVFIFFASHYILAQ